MAGPADRGLPCLFKVLGNTLVRVFVQYAKVVRNAFIDATVTATCRLVAILHQSNGLGGQWIREVAADSGVEGWLCALGVKHVETSTCSVLCWG